MQNSDLDREGKILAGIIIAMLVGMFLLITFSIIRDERSMARAQQVQK